ncbi:MAG TPA: site-2 protease family protein, partial [Gemmatimonadales bacterium]|nr:site-2 protease family protein [Gemmatimonadales bacterium]
MRWSFRLLTLFGIRIEVHVTFVLLVGGLALLQSATVPIWLTVSAMLLMFTCVLLHELGHALAARRYGIQTREIILLPIGGVARLERMPEKPVQEVVVALAGPGVNVILATLFGAALAAQGLSPEQALAQGWSGEWAVSKSLTGLLEFLFVINIAMLLFNMIPAFPMDGGRVL